MSTPMIIFLIYLSISLMFGIYEAIQFKRIHKQYATFKWTFIQGIVAVFVWPWLLIYRGGRF